MISLIDTHVHFNDTRFDHDRDSVYERARNNGVHSMIVPAVSAASFNSVQIVAKRYANVHACYGLHPVFTTQHTEDDLLTLEATAKMLSCTAIGECGLDGHVANQGVEDRQHFYFEAQLELAKKLNLPVIIHARAAVEEVLLALRRAGPGKGVVHSYNGSIQQAHRLIDLGYLVSFSGPITFPRARKLHALIKALPLDAIMLETDAPDQSGLSQKGNRNEPAFLTEVLESAALLRGEPKEMIANASNHNAMRLFNLSEAVIGPTDQL